MITLKFFLVRRLRISCCFGAVISAPILLRLSGRRVLVNSIKASDGDLN